MKYLAVVASLLLVGCSSTSEPTPEPTESAPVGATVRLLGVEGSYINMYFDGISTSPTNPNVLQVPAGSECTVLSGPQTVADATYWELDCSPEDAQLGDPGWELWGWVDVTQFEVID